MGSTVSEKTIEFLKGTAGNKTLVDLRVGLGYTFARLDDGNAGIAWTGSSGSTSCSHELKAGKLAGSPAVEVLSMMVAQSPLSRSIGLALANALIAGLPRPESDTRDVLELVNLNANDHVVMAGFFGPLIPQIKKTNCRLDIVELDDRQPDVLSPEEGKVAFGRCSVAILTSTSVVTGTIDGLLASLGNPRAVIMLGPSTIMLPEIFVGTRVTHLAGGWVRTGAADAVAQIVSEGGGTMILKPHLNFATIALQ